MSYLDANANELTGAGSAFILEPTNHKIHPDDQWSTHTAVENVDLGGYKIENLAIPSSGQDGANKDYVDNNIVNASNWYTYPAGSNVDLNSNKIENLSNPTASNDAVNKTYLTSNYYDQSTSNSNYLQTGGGNSMGANLDMGTNKITNLVDPTSAQEGATKNYVDTNHYNKSTSDSRYIRTDGANAMSANLDMGTNKITSLVDPTSAQEGATKNYVDNNSANFGKLYVEDQESFNVSVGANNFKLVTHTVGPFDNTAPHYIQSFITFWGANSSPPNDTSISMQISDGSTTYNHPIQTFSTTYQPSLPNIPQDHPDTLYMNYAVSFDNTQNIDVSVEIINNDSNTQNYNIYFFSHVIENKSSKTIY